MDKGGNRRNKNGWADFWRYCIGVNVIPADTWNKRTFVEWKQWQEQPIPEALHKEWKEKNAFKDGIAIIVGRVWHRADRLGYYLAAIDADNLKAMGELCMREGKRLTLAELAQKTLVEQHPSNPDKAHV